MPTLCIWCVQYHHFPFGNLGSFAFYLYNALYSNSKSWKNWSNRSNGGGSLTVAMALNVAWKIYEIKDVKFDGFTQATTPKPWLVEELCIESCWELMLFVDWVLAWLHPTLLSPPWKLLWTPCIMFNIVNLHPISIIWTMTHYDQLS